MRAIEVYNLSKTYRLSGAAGSRYKTLRDAVSRVSNALLCRDGKARAGANTELWALKDVSFNVEEGEALGIIGRNGAGKSTLLKVLSRITEPTSGRARLHGRVASLLEVGTGFHPELTGRENIYLNGTILGMKRAEINNRFKEIVAFSEVEQFLDTPVKHYSSGMYVRLAFAVAAHLTPEILIVDEVLAVGDNEFQRRCLGRMSNVARSGRTVLFVSHNMAAIEALCPRSILLSKGAIEKAAASTEVVAHYLSCKTGGSCWDFSGLTEREGNGRARIIRAELLSEKGNEPLEKVAFGESFNVRIHFAACERLQGPCFGLALLTERDERVFLTETTEAGLAISVLQDDGYVDCLVRSPNLLPGLYRMELWVSDVPGVSFADHLRMVGKIEIVVGEWCRHRVGGLTYHDRGRVYLPCEWSFPAQRPMQEPGPC